MILTGDQLRVGPTWGVWGLMDEGDLFKVVYP